MTTEAHSTKDKILSAARELFNEHGVESITVRHIAKHIGISHGNLCYHFPRKEDILLALYEKVVLGMSEQIEIVPAEDIRLEMVLHALVVSFRLQYEYKFLMVDFVNIMRRVPEIRENFRQIFTFRREQFRTIIKALRKQGIFVKTVNEAQYEQLHLHLYLLGDFWMSEAEILFTGEESAKLPFYAELACSLLMPYLTAKGRKEYRRFIDKTFGKAS